MCHCESSYCPSHKPSEQCPNGSTNLCPSMLYVGKICVDCATAVAANNGAQYVTAPYGTWTGE